VLGSFVPSLFQNWDYMYHIPFNADDSIAALGQPMAVIDGIPRYRK